jgi:PPOX class probable F420-dependent enzyme
MAVTSELSSALQQLLKEPVFGQIATLQPDGSPQVTQVWLDTDGKHVLVNTTGNAQKAKNVRRDARVAVNLHDPKNPWRVANIQGSVVESTNEGAEQHIDELAKRYLGKDEYPFRRPGEKRLLLKIEPKRIHTMGVK